MDNLDKIYEIAKIVEILNARKLSEVDMSRVDSMLGELFDEVVSQLAKYGIKP